MSKLSGIDGIKQAVQRRDDFNFCDTLGSFINNRQFSDGFIQHTDRRHSSAAYIWDALSAVGNQIGGVLHSGVKYYIDNVSNIDTCKVQALKSMVKQLGFSYHIFDTIDYLPIEVQDLMNLFSIDRNYIVRNGFLNENLYQSLSSYGVLFTDNRDIVSASLYQLDLFSSDRRIPNKLLGRFSEQNPINFEVSDYISSDGFLGGSRLFSNAYGADIVEVSGYYVLANEKAIQTIFPTSSISSINYFEHSMSSITIAPDVKKHLYIDAHRISQFGDSSLFIKRFDILSSGNTCINGEKYEQYVKQIYYDLLSAFLDMTYADSEHTLVRKTLDNDSYFKSGYFNQMNNEYNNLNSSSNDIKILKKQYAITGFDEITIVNNIESGNDDLENYQGIYRRILDKEIQNRASTLPFPLDYKNEQGHIISKYESTTRYSFYKKQKVLEYAKFIDDKYFNDLSSISIEPYCLNKDYIEQSINNGRDKCRVINGSTAGYSINANMVDYVAQALADTTFYIEKLRQKLKLQSRKNFMKGTQNLIKFVISEYIRDYANLSQALVLSCNAGTATAMCSLDTSDIDIQEYIDQTEYYNLSTETSKYSSNYKPEILNSRFFEQFIGPDDSGRLELKKSAKYFEFDDVIGYYLGCMELQDTDENRQYAIRLLSATFDSGAARTYIGQDGIIHSRILDGRYTRDMLVQLSALSCGYNDFMSMLSCTVSGQAFNFTYPSTIWEQEDQAKAHIVSVATEQHMSSVYSTYDKYYEQVISVAEQVSSVQDDIDNMMSSDYLYYFAKHADCQFCYNENSVYIDDQYKHDYFIGNPTYSYSNIDEQITQLNLFICNSNNIRNHVLLDTVEALLNGYDQYDGYYNLKSSLHTQIVNNITGYGYQALNSELLKTEQDNIQQFLEAKKTERISYLQEVIQQLIDQTKSMKSTYENLEEQFNSTLQNAPDFSDGYMEDLGSDKSPSTYSTSTINFIEYKLYSDAYCASCDKTSEAQRDLGFAPVVGRQKVDRISGMKMLDTDTNGGNSTKAFAFGAIPFCQIFEYHAVSDGDLISDKDSFSEKLKKMLDLMDPDKKIFYGDNAASAAGCYSTFVSIKSSLLNLKLTWDSILSQLQQVFGISYSDNRLTNFLDTENIVDLQKFLVLNLTETIYAQDSKIKIYQTYIDKLQTQINLYDKHVSILNQLVASDAYVNFVNGINSPEFTPTFLQSLSSYTIETDAVNKVIIMDRVQTANNKLTEFIEDLTRIVSGLHIFIEDSVYEKYIVDDDLQVADLVGNIIATLIRDVNNRTTDANAKIQAVIDHLLNDIYDAAFNKYIFNAIDLKWNTDNYIMCDEIERGISAVNFFQFDEYQQLVGFINEYSTISSALHPFYNYKNIIHPSIQTHQFLLNFTPQTVLRETDFTKSYINVFDQTFNFDNIDKCIDLYVGKFGQSIDLWLTNSIDYTGYVTTYEKSQHINDNGISSEVIDYDGSFYPPAAADFASSIFQDRIGNGIEDAAHRAEISLSAAKSVDQKLIYTRADISSIIYTASSRYYDYSEENCLSMADTFIYSYYGVIPSVFISSVIPSDISCHLLSSFDRTFYEKYYSHLGLSRADRLHIAGQLSTYREQILDIISEHPLSDVYDIYKYGKDKYYNCYSLYKKYGSSEPTYQQKKDVRGELWIRLKDHPIAFPAISPAPGTLSDFTFTNIELSSGEYGSEYVNSYMFTNTNNIQLSGKCFYDFDFSTEHDILLLVHDPLSTISMLSSVPNRPKDYARANVSMTYISKLEDSQLKRVIYGFNGQSDSTNDSVIKGTHSSDLYASIGNAVILSSGQRFKLVGMFPALNDQMKIVTTVFKSEDSRKIGDAELHIYTANKSNMNFVDRSVGINVPGCDNDMIAFSGYSVDNTQYLDIALYRNSAALGQCSAIGDAVVNVDTNSNGEPHDNIYASEINSHDVFSGNIIVKTYRLTSGGFSENQNIEFNTNADFAYAPSYPGLSGELYLSAFPQGEAGDCFSIELLGSSNNVDQAMLGVNISADPYLTDEDMYGAEINANGETVSSNVLLHGRVFEDYIISADNSLRIYKNPYLRHIAGNGTKLSIEISLSAPPYSYSNGDLWDMELLVYNTNCSGKNPYFAGKLIDVNRTVINYNVSDITYGNDIKVRANDYTSNFDIAVGGTFGLKSQLNYDNNNHIQNVSNIKLIYNKKRKTIRMEFLLTDSTIDCGIASDTVRFCFYSKRMLNQFKHYHLLDTYGIVKTMRQQEDEFADTWSVHYADITRYGNSYYIDPETGKKQFLKDINLDDYDFLSDVYIISPNLSSKHVELAFKAGEELAVSSVIGSRYYPTLNTCYPYNSGFYFSEDMHGISAEPVFKDSGVYIINLTDADSVLKNFGRIDIPVVVDETNDIRVFEDYNLLSTDIPGHERPGSIPNYDRYCQEDTTFNQYAHFSETPLNSRAYYYGHNLSIDEQSPEFAALSARKSEIYENTAKTEYITVADIDEQGLDISKLLKVYAGYKYENGKIYLYFNYQNLLNTPFEKYDSIGRQVADVIDGTYLKLAPGENGYLNIMLQFKYYVHRKVHGYVNGTVLTYRIFNLSDDKPKFIARRVYQPTLYEKQNAGVFQSVGNKLLLVNLPTKRINARNIPAEGIAYDVSIEASQDLSCRFEFDLEYPGYLLSCVNFREIDPTSEYDTSGLLHLSFDPGEYKKEIRFGLTKDPDAMNPYIGHIQYIQADAMSYSDDMEILAPAGQVIFIE